METLAAIQGRYSTREFTDKAVGRGLVEKIVDAGQRAPTARNVQPLEFVVVTDAGVRGQIADLAANGRFIAEAPVCIAVFCHDTKYYLEDGCAATENILLSATDLGLQSCWVAGDKKEYAEEIGKILGAPTDCKLISLLALGYGKSAGHPKPRKPLDDVLHWEEF